MFEDLPLERFGNRLPQLSIEVFRPLADPDTAEGLVRAVTLIPASGEFTYATQPIRQGSAGVTRAENLNAASDTADIGVALDRLQAMAPKVESVSLVVSWFGEDPRASACRVRPGVEVPAKETTPADFAVFEAIREMKARGLRVTFYPFIFMDVPPGNTLPNPYSDHTGGRPVGLPMARADQRAA